MQITDSNDFNLRTAVYLLQKEQREFLLIPVFHVGSKQFYQEVTTELDKCDVILYEGIDFKKLKAFGKAYRIFAKRLGLCFQKDAINMSNYRSKLVRADFDNESAKREWSKIPLISRWLFKITFPIGLIILSYGETKKSFAKCFRNRDFYDRQLWFMKNGKKNSVENFIMEKRNQVIIQKIDEQINLPVSIGKRIGVIYGAAHMKSAIAHLLRNRQFKLKDSWFLTVFWLTRREFKYKRAEGAMKKR